MAVLYVASDREGAGKTSMCAALAHMLKGQGRKVAVFKPVPAAGLSASSDPDAESFRRLLGQHADGWPLDPPEGGFTPSLLEGIRAAFHRVSMGADVALVEGSGRLSPAESGALADALDARVLVVASYRRQLTASELKPWQAQLGERLVGFVINGLTRYLGTEARAGLLPSMESEGLVCLGIVPEEGRLLGVSVAQLAEHLEGRFVVCQGSSHALVEHLMVGGMGMDPGELHFGIRENKAVIVRGDRPDVQMAALGTPTACMVLTNGIEPIEYVKYEAEQEEVPVMVVQTDTLATMSALNTLIDQARFDHPRKLSRYSELLQQHVNLPVVLRGLGLS